MSNARLENLKTLLNNKKVELEVCKQNKKKSDEINNERIRLENLSSDLASYLNSQKSLYAILKTTDSKYKEDRLSFVTEIIKSNIDSIFPDADLTPKLNYTTKRNKQTLDLVLVDRYGNERHPKNTEGGLYQQLISFSSSMSIVFLKGSKIFYIDEAFGNGSPANRAKVGNIINDYASRGIQIILITQSDELFINIPRREIRLQLDKVSNEAKCIQISDEGVIE